MDFYGASSLKEQSAGRHVAPLGHIILIPGQPVFALSRSWCVLSREATHANFRIFGLTRPPPWPDRGSNPRSTTLEASTLTIKPLMRLFFSLAIHEHLRAFRLGSCHLTFHSSLTNGTTAQGVYLLFRPKDLVSRLVGCKYEPWGYSVLDVVGWLVYRKRKKKMPVPNITKLIVGIKQHAKIIYNNVYCNLCSLLPWLLGVFNLYDYC